MSGTFHRLHESLSSAKESASQKLSDIITTNEKILNMWPNMVDTTRGVEPMTTDTGVEVQDTDHWLRVVSEKQQGPSLLEDQVAREKLHRCGPLLVSLSGALQAALSLIEKTQSTMRGYQSVWFTHGVPVHTATLNSTSQSQSSHLLESSTILDTQPPFLSVFPPFLGLGGLQTLYRMHGVLLSSSTPRKAIGTSLETTFPCSSSRMP